MDCIKSCALFCLIFFASAAGAASNESCSSVLNFTGVEGEAVILTLPLAEGAEAQIIDWRYKRLQMESKIASFLHGHITTDDDDQFSSRLVLNTSALFLKIEPLHLEDSGQYIAEIKLNGANKFIQRFNLTVYVKISSIFLKKTSGSTNCLPENSEKLSPMNKENCSFVLECWVEKGSNVTFYWQKNGINVTTGISTCSHNINLCSRLEGPLDSEYCNASYSCSASNAVSTKTEYIKPCSAGGQKKQTDNGMRHIIGLIIGLILLVMTLIVIVSLLCWERKKKHKSDEEPRAVVESHWENSIQEPHLQRFHNTGDCDATADPGYSVILRTWTSKEPESIPKLDSTAHQQRKEKGHLLTTVYDELRFNVEEPE